MRAFDTVVAVDWSARNAPSPARPSADAIWAAVAREEGVETVYLRTRAAAMGWIEALARAEVEAGRRALLGFDFPLGWPRGFAGRVAGAPSALAAWDRLAEWVEDDERNRSNRWAVAARLNDLFPGTGPFWGCPAGEAREGLAPDRAGWGGHGLPERRLCEERVRRAQPGWKLAYTGSVGSQALLGQARLAGLRRRLPCAVWPFEDACEAPVVIAEIYPSLLGDALPGAGIRDEEQVRLTAFALRRLARDGRLLDAPPEAAPEEGWILGLGFEAALRAAAREPERPAAAASSQPAGAPRPRSGAPAHARDPDASGRAPPKGAAPSRPPSGPAATPHAGAGRPFLSRGGPAEAVHRAGSPSGGLAKAPAAGAEAPCPGDAGPAPLSPRAEGGAPTPSAPTGAAGASLPAPLPLRDDCFALPPGVDWTPVDVALARLRARLAPVACVETRPVAEALGRALAADAVARRASPPAANAAVDGWGFAHAAAGPGPNRLPIAPGRAAAGAPLGRPLPAGQAVRILTGALLPAGVDTVILQEDAEVEDGRVAFAGPVRRGANTRAAGEDVEADAVALPAGRRLGPADLALLVSLGIAEVAVRRPLRVGVLSTGDELADPGETLDPARTFDANRPMLLALLRRWDHEAVDLGRAPDDRGALRDRLDRATGGATGGVTREAGCDAILASGGASAGEEDHVSALLAAEGAVETWRVAMKPGRPLALGLWRGVPLFGLPGNPVAAFVCALLFARPALSALAGAGWSEPPGFAVPAAFAKRKKAGRREFLRARIREGRAEVFASEGSGRVSGLAWAEGLVDLGEEAREVSPGDPVRYLPFGSFGL